MKEDNILSLKLMICCFHAFITFLTNQIFNLRSAFAKAK
ncbi:hypothetical protein JCM19298_3053 [Nonlabens ulvanivorans]|nr:hypothetical protein JCM19297_2832 [Nonlabens ulvanivorans]GAK92565.1 hypothetical protein JCM19298_3053 [Nonlabens ulvanivorans]